MLFDAPHTGLLCTLRLAGIADVSTRLLAGLHAFRPRSVGCVQMKRISRSCMPTTFPFDPPLASLPRRSSLLTRIATRPGSVGHHPSDHTATDSS